MDNNNLTEDTEDGRVWPPPPSLLPPVSAQPKPLMARITIWMAALIDMGTGLVLSGFSYLWSELSHQPVSWRDVIAQGSLLALTLFIVHLWARRKLA